MQVEQLNRVLVASLLVHLSKLLQNFHFSDGTPSKSLVSEDIINKLDGNCLFLLVRSLDYQAKGPLSLDLLYLIHVGGALKEGRAFLLSNGIFKDIL